MVDVVHYLNKDVRLNIGERVYELMNDDAIHREAAELARHCTLSNRTIESVEQDSVPALAIQHAVLELLALMGARYDRPAEGVFQYDGILDGTKVDVKVRFNGKRWQQSQWEARKLKETGERVLYLCIDVTIDCVIIFKGCIWGEELEPSMYGSPYVLQHKLQPLNLVQG